MSKDAPKQAVQTTGHAWDGDLQEFNNPLPRWWLWSFYATVVFALIYWLLFPAWPVGKSYTKGVLNEISYTDANGKEVSTHWNTRSLLAKEMQESRDLRQQYVAQLQTMAYREIRADQKMNEFAYSMAKVLFADNCAACHQAGGAGVIGYYPNLADDAWLWGGTYKQIESTIRDGHTGFMPAFENSLTDQQLDDVASYVLAKSDEKVDAAQMQRGAEIFNGEAGGCYYCHTKEASGMISLGSANLTDHIWTIADVPGQSDLSEKTDAVKQVIRDGVSRKMPAWKDRLSETEIRMLTFYVHQLGGGK